MKTSIFPLILLGLSILNASCTKEVRYSKEELYRMARAADSSITFVLPKSISEGVTCVEYGEGCLSGHTVMVKNLEMIAVEFSSEEQAKNAAIKFRGYYARNWLFDDVSGEPVLEKFVSEKLQAKKP
jgi:hypothetical protein